MKWKYACLLIGVILTAVITCEAFPFPAGHIDYMEALRRMQQVPQWHCMRYRKFHLHGHCSRWLLMRRT
ncbi:unnamed protein product [Arctia plantaginis]|uniref:Uncharacterized protein n=1 Tax=Arctia plantaginis TaxID=874455 RepID=A0A8S0YQ99_ARCPL|nr:unnamed protein product [Arctia plantaginis]CAB3261415.1 unnamed protein product [Arctia plantaginis]